MPAGAEDEEFDYSAYVEAFNRGDDAALVDRYYADDVHFAGTSVTAHGREQLLDFLHRAHDGVRETLRHQLVVRDGDNLAVEVDMDFHATEDRPAFVFGPLTAGDHMTVKFFCFYRIHGGRIVSLRTATWERGRGVTPAPTCFRPGSLGKRAYLDYVLAFNTRNTERFIQFYNDDVELKLPSVPAPLTGPRAIGDFYREMYESVHEQLTVNTVSVDDESLWADANCRFTAIKDAPDFAVGPLRKGESYEGRTMMHYTLRDGRISRIAVGRMGDYEHKPVGG